jgi:hypothetical protein
LEIAWILRLKAYIGNPIADLRVVVKNLYKSRCLEFVKNGKITLDPYRN